MMRSAVRQQMLRCAVVAGFCLGGAGTVMGQGPAAPAIVRACGQCHGPQGLSVAPDAPHLAGQPRPYLIAQLKAFRSGARRHEVMNVVAKPLSDDDIGAAADWFSSLSIELRQP